MGPWKRSLRLASTLYEERVIRVGQDPTRFDFAVVLVAAVVVVGVFGLGG